jgi:TonB family protein
MRRKTRLLEDRIAALNDSFLMACLNPSLRTLPILLLLLGLVTAHGQGTEGVSADDDSPTTRIVKQTDPVYPPNARAAHVSGEVKLKVEIGKDGHVTGSKVISGPPMLVDAARECVEEWVYEPVVIDGQAVSVSTVVTINFDPSMPGAAEPALKAEPSPPIVDPSAQKLDGGPKAELMKPKNPNDEAINSRYLPLSQACVKAVSANVDPPQQVDACKKAAQVAETYSDEERFIERRSAFVYASTALRRDKQFAEALDYANKAVTVVELGHDDGSGSSAAYSVRAQVEAQFGDLTDACDDFSVAEDFERKAITTGGGPDNDVAKRQYVPVLKGMLTYHAKLLTTMGKPEEAAATAAEAAKL